VVPVPDELGDAETVSFRVRPVSVPGELRISWRLAVVVLMLEGCRKQRASLVKLHVLNDAVRSDDNAQLLRRVLRDELPPSFWRTRVEPAFGRALDLAVGSGLVNWIHTTLGAGLELTTKGKEAVAAIHKLKGVLEHEKTALAALAPQLSEQRAASLTSPKAVARA
jgi:hypothetical protein